MNLRNITKHRLFLPILIGVLSLAGIAALVTLFVMYHNFHLEGELHAHYRNRVAFEEHDTNFRINTLKPWMTFDYINVVFKLPSSYLQTKLDITDPRYPKLRIDTYARSNNEDPNHVLMQVQSSVSASFQTP